MITAMIVVHATIAMPCQTRIRPGHTREVPRLASSVVVVGLGEAAAADPIAPAAEQIEGAEQPAADPRDIARQIADQCTGCGF
ncbi:hypothetical protein ACH61_01905 [Rathayibacter tanaceti]|uniref:Uncharacterized protein n=2 Tax=Rathayibacter tanaceti TaxID=1671680 RepID=A0A166HPM2_9MICO|nr:hypothetical protein ACH61_01905 [Rathayibacter tanaceti]